MTEDALAELLRRHPNAKATRLLTGFISNDAGLTRSELEELFPRFCERYGLPRPLMNVCVGGYLVTRTSPSTG